MSLPGASFDALRESDKEPCRHLRWQSRVLGTLVTFFECGEEFASTLDLLYSRAVNERGALAKLSRGQHHAGLRQVLTGGHR